MRKVFVSILIVIIIMFTFVIPAAAITGGQEDENRHPYGALLLVPGFGFCSGTLIDEDLVLTAGHCIRSLKTNEIQELWVTFDPYAAVDPATWEITDGTWYTASSWKEHPGYTASDLPFIFDYDYGLVFLDKPVVDIAPAALPEKWIVDGLVGTTGQTNLLFNDVGYGQSGVSFEQKPYVGNFDFIRKFSIQRYNPSNGSFVGTRDPRLLILQNNPSENHGGACNGDSGSGIFLDSGQSADTILAVHTGGYPIGYLGMNCGMMTSFNLRVDLPEVLDWITIYIN